MGRRTGGGKPVVPSRLDLTREAVESLKAEVLGSDRLVKRRYIQEFHAEYQSWEEISTWDELLLDCWKAGIVYLGDYHALPASQMLAARLLADLAQRSRKLALAVEVVRGVHQEHLDAWLTGRLGEREFLRRIRYERDWGYPWEGFRHLIATAQEHGIPVVAVDCDPRRGLRLIRKRDRSIAARLTRILQEDPERRLVVHMGESHLASGHLPRQVRESLHSVDMERRDVVVVQNAEEIYWGLLGEGHDHFDVVRVADRRWCVFTATPLEKYEAYRQVQEAWDLEETDGERDYQPVFHGIIDSLLGLLGVDKYTWCLSEEGICLELLVDGYPEVYGPHRVSEVPDLLADLPLDRIEQARRCLEAMGCCYVPEANAVFLSRFQLAESAEVAARFVWTALSGRLHTDPPPPSDPADRFWAAVLTEIRAWFGSKAIQPGRSIPATGPPKKVRTALDRLLGQIRADPEGGRRVPKLLREDPVAPRILGHELGQELWLAWRRGEVRRRELLDLFTDPLTSPDAARRRVRGRLASP